MGVQSVDCGTSGPSAFAWVRIKVDGTITRETDDDTTYIEADGLVLKMTEYVDAMMSGDGVALSRRTPDTIAAITEDGVIAKARD
ncbi:hypothetical protein [Yoonia sp.]|uniref:hypothetical protein n=1 Tax=Yoonia sp. TaxID=2212373 RepID=UPI00358F6D91